MPVTALTTLLAFAAEGEATEEGEAALNPVIPFLNDLFWAAIFFGGLFLLFKYVALPPVLKNMEARDEKLRAERATADEAHKSLTQAQADYDQALADARAEANGVIEAARAEADEYRTEVMDAAKAEVGSEREMAMAGVNEAHDSAADQLTAQVSTIAIGAAEKVLGRSIDPAAQRPVIDRVLGQANRNDPPGGTS